MSIKSSSRTVKRSRIHYLWRRALCFALPHYEYLQQEEVNLVHTTPINPGEEPVWIPDRMSGALPNDEFCRNYPNRPPCLTKSCETPAIRDSRSPAHQGKPYRGPSAPPAPPKDQDTPKKSVQWIDTRTRNDPSFQGVHSTQPKQTETDFNELLGFGQNVENEPAFRRPRPPSIRRKPVPAYLHRPRSLSPLAEVATPTVSGYTHYPPIPNKSNARPGSVRSARLAANAELIYRPLRPESRYGTVRPMSSAVSLRSVQSCTFSEFPEDDFVNPRRAPSPPAEPASIRSLPLPTEGIVTPRASVVGTKASFFETSSPLIRSSFSSPRTIRPQRSVQPAPNALRTAYANETSKWPTRSCSLPRLTEVPYPNTNNGNPCPPSPFDSPQPDTSALTEDTTISDSSSSIYSDPDDHEIQAVKPLLYKYPPAGNDIPLETRWSFNSNTARQLKARTSVNSILVTRTTTVAHTINRSGLHLRGGGDEDGDQPAGENKSKRKKRPLTGLDEEGRPHPVLWWLAGGKVGNRRKVPTIQELKERKRVEMENRKDVGFWGTVFGVRRVH